ncbi:MAG: F-type H+-transporting ATPase subunit alpha [Chloroflexi bacterium]|nr:MAG: F-type H+-transporting ATPase subunit alpha [Chloroflexota bacterium]
MAESLKQYTEGLTNRIDSFEMHYQVRNIGIVFEAGDGIAQVDGLTGVRSQELVQFENGTMGIAFNLEKNRVGIIILGDYSSVYEGMKVETTGRIASVPVGERLIGRVVNALGEPIDGKGEIKTSRFQPLERIAPGVIERRDVDTPVQTGIKSIDAMIPVGRGQRELIIGDRQTGKTAIAIDTIINQKDKDLICIYVAIGQKKAAVARTVALLEHYGAMEHTIVVSASADEAAAMLYIAPYAGCAIGEDFMQRGFDALVVYDDLSKHAWAYRQLSLLLRRPPGREAYPGDVFYLHSRLLERAANMANEYAIVPTDFDKHTIERKNLKAEEIFGGPMSMHYAHEKLKTLPDKDKKKIVKVHGSGGTLTALPIIETLLGDVSAYIPTNVISITDGQIYLEGSLFNAGIRPAVNVGISVSRVGGAAQTKAMKQVAGRLRLDMANFRELAAFAQFGSDLDKATLGQLNRGLRLQEILKQPQYEPVTLENQVLVLYAGINGFADSVPLEKIKIWQTDLLRFFETSYPDVEKSIFREKKINPETETQLKEAMELFTASWN